MAGMRIGYAMGSETLIKALNDGKHAFNSYTMNLPSIITGVRAIEDEEYFIETLSKIKATRQKTAEELAKLGFTFPESKANFIFAKHEKIAGIKIYDGLCKRRIYVRHFNKPRIDDYVRITIGTDEQMKTAINAIKEIIG